MGEEQEYLQLHTYTKAWKLERVIYKIENWTLPFPISLDQLMVFAATEFLMLVLWLLPGVGHLVGLKPFLSWVLIPFGLTWYVTRVAVDGKNPLFYVWARVRHALHPKLLYRYREYALAGSGRKRFVASIEIRNNVPKAWKRVKKEMRAG